MRPIQSRSHAIRKAFEEWDDATLQQVHVLCDIATLFHVLCEIVTFWAVHPHGASAAAVVLYCHVACWPSAGSAGAAAAAAAVAAAAAACPPILTPLQGVCELGVCGCALFSRIEKM